MALGRSQEPQLVELPAAATKLSCGELGTAALLETGEVYAWGMGRFFEPTKLPTDAAVDDAIVDVHVGAYHLALLSASGRLWTCTPPRSRRARRAPTLRTDCAKGRGARRLAPLIHAACCARVAVGTGAPLALPRGVRQQWEVREVAFEGRRVLSCATGPYTTYAHAAHARHTHARAHSHQPRCRRSSELVTSAHTRAGPSSSRSERSMSCPQNDTTRS
jgi:hypothetical protein